MGLLFTLLLGIFILMGAFIVFVSKNNNKFIQFSVSFAFGVILMLISIDLIPETYETIDTGNGIYNILYIIVGAAIGFLFLKILDTFIPDHEDDIETTEDDERNFRHLGLVSSIALVLHNLVEGMAIYLLVNSDLKAGILASIGVGLHNIPLGMMIASFFYKASNSKKKTFLYLFGISLSTFIGGLAIYFFPSGKVLDLVEGISLCLTLGMLVYILLLELLPKVIHQENKKITKLGIFLGILLLLFTIFL